MKSDVIEITGVILHETEMAVLFADTGSEDDAVWLPKSQIEVHENPANARYRDIVLPERLALEKDLI